MGDSGGGEAQEGGSIYMPMADSHCTTAETDPHCKTVIPQEE